MIVAATVILAFWLFCGGMSVLAGRESGPHHHGVFHLASVATFLGLLGLLMWALGHAAGPRGGIGEWVAWLLVALTGVGLGFRYWTFLIGEYFQAVHSAAMGVESMSLERTFDRADAAVREGRIDDALRLYEGEAARDGADPEPLRRAAEVCVGARRAPEGRRYFDRALERTAEARAYAILAFRAAEVAAAGADGREKAARILREAERRAAGTEFARFARERLERLASP